MLTPAIGILRDENPDWIEKWFVEKQQEMKGALLAAEATAYGGLTDQLPTPNHILVEMDRYKTLAQYTATLAKKMYQLKIAARDEKEFATVKFKAEKCIKAMEDVALKMNEVHQFTGSLIAKTQQVVNRIL